MRYRIDDTPCRPNRYKVVWVGYRDDNSPSLYHPTKEAAHAFAQSKHYNMHPEGSPHN